MIPTRFTPLHAMYTRPSGAAAMFRITPPPPGTGSLEKRSFFGSNFTMVFGCKPDSLYQTVPSLVIAIP